VIETMQSKRVAIRSSIVAIPFEAARIASLFVLVVFMAKPTLA